MTQTQKPQTNAGASGNIDIRVLAQIFKSQKNKRLIYKPEQPNSDGTKNIVWDNNDIDWSKHISGELLQGGNPAVDGAAVYSVVDVDRDKKTGSIFKDLKAREKDLTEQEQICRDVWNIDNKVVVLQGRLKPEEESRLIEDTMIMIGNIKGFKGVELAVVEDSEDKTFFQKMRFGLAKAIAGQQNAITIIGPASVVKEMKKDPKKLEVMMR